MPIYEYACAACGHEFEEWQKMSDAPVKTCPKCKKKKVERLISKTAFQLKGGGWYADLYSSSKPGDGKGDAADKAESKDGGSSAKDSPKEAAASSEGSAKSAGKASDSASPAAATKKKSAKKAESRAA